MGRTKFFSSAFFTMVEDNEQVALLMTSKMLLVSLKFEL
jgi:hypothetical protein